jgi:excisionase family DNA binding protein
MTRPTPKTATQRRPEFMTLEAAAEWLDVHPRSIRRWIARGELPGYRLGSRALRVRVRDLEALIRRIPTSDIA